MADADKGLMSGGGMEITSAGERIKDFNAQIDNWNRVAAGKEGREKRWEEREKEEKRRKE